MNSADKHNAKKAECVFHTAPVPISPISSSNPLCLRPCGGPMPHQEKCLCIQIFSCCLGTKLLTLLSFILFCYIWFRKIWGKMQAKKITIKSTQKKKEKKKVKTQHTLFSATSNKFSSDLFIFDFRRNIKKSLSSSVFFFLGSKYWFFCNICRQSSFFHA